MNNIKCAVTPPLCLSAPVPVSVPVSASVTVPIPSFISTFISTSISNSIPTYVLRRGFYQKSITIITAQPFSALRQDG